MKGEGEAKPREQANELAAKIAGLDDEAAQKITEENDASAVLERAERVRQNLLTFAREHRLMVELERQVAQATRDERSLLARMTDGLRTTMVDSQTFPRRENPDISVEEADEILKSLEALAPMTQLRAVLFLAERLPATVAMQPGVGSRFRSFVRNSNPTELKQARCEQELFDKLDRARSADSSAGEKLSEAEMRALLQLINEMPPERATLYRDALAAICLTSVAYAPSPRNRNATLAAQELLADRFWQGEEGNR